MAATNKERIKNGKESYVSELLLIKQGKQTNKQSINRLIKWGNSSTNANRIESRDVKKMVCLMEIEVRRKPKKGADFNIMKYTLVEKLN